MPENKKKILVAVIPVALFISLVLILIAFLSKSGPANLLRFTVSEDAYVTDASPDKVFNNRQLLLSNAESDCSSENDCDGHSSKIYLKFEVSGLQNRKIAYVKLRLNATNTSGDGGQVYLLDTTNWSESNLTWNNAPKPSGQSIGSFNAIADGGWKEVSLPPKAIPKDGTYEFVIQNNDRNAAGYKSGNNFAGRPELIISFDNSRQTDSYTDKERSYTIAAAGDISCEGGEKVSDDDCMQKETSDLIGVINPDAVLVLGDVQYENGFYEHFMNNFQASWGRYKNLLRPAVGNHEYNNSEYVFSDGCSSKKPGDPFASACGYFDYFNGKGQITGLAGERGKGFYAFSLGRWRLYSINSNCDRPSGCGPGSEQERWLRGDLAKYPNTCKLMYMHHPLVASDVRNFDAYLQGLPFQSAYLPTKANQDALAALYKAFYDYQGDVVLAGHSHFYERFAPQDLNREADEFGFRQIVVGTGGRYTYAVTTDNLRPLSETYSPEKAKGILKMNLETQSYSWEFKPVAGTNFSDSGTGSCHYAK